MTATKSLGDWSVPQDVRPVDPSGLKALGQVAATSPGALDEDVVLITRRTHANRRTAAELSGLPRSMRDAVISLTDELFWQPAGRLTDTLRQGCTIFEEIFGMPAWDYLGTNQEAGDRFDAGIPSFSGPEDAAIADTYDFARARSVLDVGGGRGGLLRILLSQNPHLRGVLYDRKSVLEAHLLDQPELSGRWVAVAGDFMASVPPGSDLHILKHILHDWNDQECIPILRHCRRAMTDDSPILIAETIAPQPNTPHYVWTLDMIMMALITGLERTRDEFEPLFAAADLRLTRIIATSTFSALSILEAAPISPCGDTTC